MKTLPRLRDIGYLYEYRFEGHAFEGQRQAALRGVRRVRPWLDR
jgi:hypothetical protein